MDERETIRFVPNEFYIDTGRHLFASIANYAMITIAGAEYRYPIASTVIRDGFFKHYFDVEDEPIGNIERLELYDVNGGLLGETVGGVIEKDDDGWSIAIKLFVILDETEVEGGIANG
ncbi:hypothetical protein [Sporosarcina sp. FSL W7-1283]|uniref:hypothetical protein n=1 Tax=Sporosarcina sp. FSL W7-1283 TaxID=2921560 RepID=UPI0030F7E000